MTEKEWLECNDPGPMLNFLRRKVSKRKFRLFACACARRLWSMLDAKHRSAVEAAEKFADRQLSAAELARWYHRMKMMRPETKAAGYTCGATNRLWAATEATAYCAQLAFATAADFRPNLLGGLAYPPEAKAQAGLLRCVVGLLPFHPAILPPIVLAWNDGIVPQIAQAIYDERAFGRLPILADALEEAGCTDPAILEHCRELGPHARGCWIVDLALLRC